MTDMHRTALTPKLVDQLYVEAMLLADEARAYFDQAGRQERLGLAPVLRVGFSCESLKITTRLMHIIAWLLTQRAVAAGELTAGQAAHPERRLGHAPGSEPEAVDVLPEAAQRLVLQSQDLYARIARIDAGADQEDAPPSPARSLMSRLQRAF